MTEFFTFKPISPSTGTTKFRTKKAQFGDGYSQEVADGVQNKVQSWPLRFLGKSQDDMQDIMTFLDARAGWESFYWTPPLGVMGLYRASEYTLSPISGSLYVLDVTFQEVFAP